MLRYLSRQKLGSIYRGIISSGLPWYIPEDGAPADARALRAFGRRAIFLRWGPVVRPIGLVLSIPGWFWRFFVDIGPSLDTDTYVGSRFYRALKLLWVHLRYNVDVYEYVHFGMGRANAAPIDCYISQFEAACSNTRLAAPLARQIANDKSLTAEFCEEHGFPIPKTLALWREGKVVKAFSNDRPPVEPMILKSFQDAGGHGVELWDHKNDRVERQADPIYDRPAQDLSVTEFMAFLEDQADPGILVEQMACAHPELLNPLASQPPVLRLVTGRWPDDRVEILTGTIQAPVPGQAVSQGGKLRIIDVLNGHIEPKSFAGDPVCEKWSIQDPEFDNLPVPFWSETVDLMKRLHQTLPGPVPILGSDVVITPDGPVILEFNIGAGCFFEQLFTKQPAANGRWAQVLVAHLP